MRFPYVDSTEWWGSRTTHTYNTVVEANRNLCEMMYRSSVSKRFRTYAVKRNKRTWAHNQLPLLAHVFSHDMHHLWCKTRNTDQTAVATVWFAWHTRDITGRRPQNNLRVVLRLALVPHFSLREKRSGATPKRCVLKEPLSFSYSTLIFLMSLKNKLFQFIDMMGKL